MKRIILLFVLVILLFGCGGENKIDASTDESLKKSIEIVKKPLSKEKKKEFEDAILAITFSDINIFKAAANPDGMKRRIKDKLNGKTVSEIIAEGNRIVAERKKEEREQAIIEREQAKKEKEQAIIEERKEKEQAKKERERAIIEERKERERAIIEERKERERAIIEERKEKEQAKKERERAIIEKRKKREQAIIEKRKKRKQAIIEIKELKKKVIILEKKKQKAKEELKKFKIIKSRFYFYKDYFTENPAIELIVKNNTDYAISRVYFYGVLISSGRAIPWVKESFNYKISGGLESGEKATWQLAPSMFGKWSKAPKNRNDMILTVIVNGIDGADEKPIYGSEFLEMDKLNNLKEQIANLKKSIK